MLTKIITKKSLIKLFQISSALFNIIIKNNQKEFEKFQYKLYNSEKYNSFNYVYNKEFLELWVQIFKSKIKDYIKVKDELKYKENIGKLVHLLKNYDKISKHDFLINKNKGVKR